MGVRNERGSVVVIVLVVVAVLGLGGYLYYRSAPAPQEAELTPEAKAYVRNLQLGEVSMQANESFMQQTLVEITGTITNAGDRALSEVEIHCIFYDPYNQPVLRQRVGIVRSKTGGLNPGETKPFRLPFDSLPENWNQGMPQMVIAGINFQ